MFPIPSFPPSNWGNDSYTKLLVHADGSNGSTSFVDSSHFTKTLTANGTAKIGTAQSKFGGSSAAFDGTSGCYVNCGDSADYKPTGDFTIDFWFYGTGSGSQIMTAKTTSTSLYSPYLFLWNAPNFQFFAASGTTSWDIIAGSVIGSIGANNWYHGMVARQGSSWYGALNGVVSSLGSSGTALMSTTDPLLIGARQSTTGDLFTGYIDEFRFSNGIARWTANFVPPSRPYW